MSMEINVFFCGKLPSKAALSDAMTQLGFPLTITPDAGSLHKQKGFMPMRLDGKESGVEFDVFDGRADVEDIANGREVDAKFDRSANFRWGGDEGEMLCALCASAALAQLTGGVVLGDDDDEPLSPEQAIVAARQSLESVLKRKPRD